MVVAGLTELVAVPDDDVVDVVACVVVCCCDEVAVLLDSAAEDVTEVCVVDEDKEVEVVIVFRVVDVVRVVEIAVAGFVDEDATEDADDAEVKDAEAMPVDSEIKLPPLDNRVTVCCPLITTVGAVTVVCGTPLLCDTPEVVADVKAELIALVPALDTAEVLVVKSKEYVVLGSKLEGNVAKADESTESAFVVCAGCSVAVAGHPAMLSAQEVMVV